MSSVPRPITPSRGGPQQRPASQQHSRSNSGIAITVPAANNNNNNNNNTISPSPNRFVRNSNQPQNGGTGQQQQQPPQRDPFVSLEDETEKSLHILNQLRDRHRQIVAKMPEVADSSRLRSAQQPTTTATAAGNPNDPNSSAQPTTMTTAKPSSVEWHSVPVQLLVELDEITEQTDELINDASQDIELLKATVQKHVDGAAFDAVVELDSDEISRRVEIVHAFERKLRQSRNELQNMIKAKDFRQMQLGDYATAYYEKKNKGGAGGTSAETPLKGNYSNKNGGGAASPQPNSGESDRPANEFAANYIKQEMEEQNRISAQHAVIIDQIHMGIMSAADKAKLINVALKESEQKLGFVDKQIDNIQNRLDSALQGLNKLLESTSERNKMIIICVLTFVLILLLLALFSGSSSSSS